MWKPVHNHIWYIWKGPDIIPDITVVLRVPRFWTTENIGISSTRSAFHCQAKAPNAWKVGATQISVEWITSWGKLAAMPHITYICYVFASIIFDLCNVRLKKLHDPAALRCLERPWVFWRDTFGKRAESASVACCGCCGDICRFRDLSLRGPGLKHAETLYKAEGCFVFQLWQEVDEADFAGGGLGQLHDLAIRSQSRGNKATWQGEVRGWWRAVDGWKMLESVRIC